MRPIWNLRNTHVHSLSDNMPSLQMLADIKTEATELYNNTDPTTLSSTDQNLFQSSLETILTRTYYQIQTWCSSVEVAIAHAASSLLTNTDPNQTSLSFAPTPVLPPPHAEPIPLEPYPTSQNAPALTPVQCRIKRRRLQLQRNPLPQHVPTLPHLTPPPTPELPLHNQPLDEMAILNVLLLRTAALLQMSLLLLPFYHAHPQQLPPSPSTVHLAILIPLPSPTPQRNAPVAALHALVKVLLKVLPPLLVLWIIFGHAKMNDEIFYMAVGAHRRLQYIFFTMTTSSIKIILFTPLLPA